MKNTSEDFFFLPLSVRFPMEDFLWSNHMGFSVNIVARCLWYLCTDNLIIQNEQY